jgi:hypothetical protein
MIAEKKEVFMAGKKTMGSKSGFVGKRGYGWVPDVPDQRRNGGRWCGEFREGKGIEEYLSESKKVKEFLLFRL